MKLSTLALTLGVLYSLPQVYGLLKPAGFIDSARRFPRSLPWGYALMALGTLWFLYNVSIENISDFASYKNIMLIGFGAVGLMTCLFVKDYLAVRGLAVVLLLLAQLVLETARWHDSQWRLLLSTWAYVWILAGMWFIISPWRLRDLIEWMTASEARVRVGSLLRLALGLLVAGLGLFAF